MSYAFVYDRSMKIEFDHIAELKTGLIAGEWHRQRLSGSLIKAEH